MGPAEHEGPLSFKDRGADSKGSCREEFHIT